MPTTITPCQATRKSARTIRKPNCMDDVVTTPNPVGVVIRSTLDQMTEISPTKIIKLNPTSKARKLIRLLQVKCDKPLPCTDDVSTKDILQVHLMTVRDIIVQITILNLTYTTSGW